MAEKGETKIKKKRKLKNKEILNKIKIINNIGKLLTLSLLIISFVIVFFATLEYALGPDSGRHGGEFVIMGGFLTYVILILAGVVFIRIFRSIPFNRIYIEYFHYKIRKIYSLYSSILIIPFIIILGSTIDLTRDALFDSREIISFRLIEYYDINIVIPIIFGWITLINILLLFYYVHKKAKLFTQLTKYWEGIPYPKLKFRDLNNKQVQYPSYPYYHYPRCPTCGGGIRFIYEYHRWYCDNCVRYL